MSTQSYGGLPDLAEDGESIDEVGVVSYIIVNVMRHYLYLFINVHG